MVMWLKAYKSFICDQSLDSLEGIMRVILATLISNLIIGSALANNFMEFGVDDYETKESKWQFDVGIDYLSYPTTMPEFKGEHYKNRDTKNYEVYGLSLGFGRDLFMVGGFSVAAKIGGFYYRSFDNEKGQAAKDIDVELASNRRQHNLYGGTAEMSINYIFEGKKVDIQPFVFGGVGVGQANIEREYSFKGLGTTDSAQEADSELYDVSIEDTFSYRSH